MTVSIGGLLVENTGELRVADQSVHPGEDSTLDRTWGGEKWDSSYISSAATTVIKTGAGVLGGITIGETAAGAITVYNNTAASGAVLAVLKASVAEGTYKFNIKFSAGLTVVTAGASKLTVSYL